MVSSPAADPPPFLTKVFRSGPDLAGPKLDRQGPKQEAGLWTSHPTPARRAAIYSWGCTPQANIACAARPASPWQLSYGRSADWAVADGPTGHRLIGRRATITSKPTHNNNTKTATPNCVLKGCRGAVGEVGRRARRAGRHHRHAVARHGRPAAVPPGRHASVFRKGPGKCSLMDLLSEFNSIAIDPLRVRAA